MSGFKTCDRVWKAGVKNSGMLQGDYPGSYRPVSRPAMALRNVRGMLLAASQGKPRELGGGSVLQPWGIPLRVTMVAMVASPHAVGMEPPGSPVRRWHIKAVPIHFPHHGVGRPWWMLRATPHGYLLPHPCLRPSLCPCQHPCFSSQMDSKKK